MSEENAVRIAVVGAGAFGRNHLRVLRSLAGVQLAGVMDTNPESAAAAAAEFGCPVRAELDRSMADAAVVATPTSSHAGITCHLLEAGLDVLVEKPLASTVDEAERMTATAAQHGRILQVGHLERFNPAVRALEQALTVPLFFEVHRLSVFSPRSLDVDVVLDLMIHDLEIVLGLARQRPREIRAAGIQILSGKVDIANVRLEFPNGCIANLTASRVSTERVRKLRVFQPGQYLSVDYAKQEMFGIAVSPDRQISFLPVSIQKDEPLRAEVAHFAECVRTRRAPLVGAAEATDALRVAHDILASIERHGQQVAATLAATFTGGEASLKR
jgi:predicted dehydrogenase